MQHENSGKLKKYELEKPLFYDFYDILSNFMTFLVFGLNFRTFYDFMTPGSPAFRHLGAYPVKWRSFGCVFYIPKVSGID